MPELRNNDTCSCPNGYENSAVFMENFGNDESLKKCSNCNNFETIDGGTFYCSKFSGGNKNGN